MKNRKTRNVLITGASTGIGEACTLYLASRGWHVFAGVRKEQDGKALVAKAGPSVTPIMLDVTNSDQIAAAVEQMRVAVGEAGLQGLVNNAGIVVAGPLEFIPLQKIRTQLEVNVLGLIAVTQSFLPMIRAARGRIVLMGSTSGYWCEPFVAPYGASKFALEGIADSLRVELRPWGIDVALIEPGMILTPIWEKSSQASEQMAAQLPGECEALYSRQLEAMRKAVGMASKLAIPPERVAHAVCHALESSRPRTRYQVGMDARLQFCLRCWIPDRLRDRINRWVLGI